jgi:hypothetical protein
MALVVRIHKARDDTRQDLLLIVKAGGWSMAAGELDTARAEDCSKANRNSETPCRVSIA